MNEKKYLHRRMCARENGSEKETRNTKVKTITMRLIVIIIIIIIIN